MLTEFRTLARRLWNGLTPTGKRGSLARCPPAPALTALALAFATPAAAADQTKTITGTIMSFECGDNCYLIIQTGPGAQQAALCAAPECMTWNETTVMPRSFVSKRVRAIMGAGTQLYGDGSTAGTFPAFRSIKVLK